MMGLRSHVEAIATFFLFDFLGLFFAYLTYYLYDKGIVIDEMVTGKITITDLMFFVFLFWVLLGLIVGFLMTRRD